METGSSRPGGYGAMAAKRQMRASDRDRDQVVEALREQVAEGRLTFEEFEERIDRAYTARTWDELDKLTEDLPVRVVFAADEVGAAETAERPRDTVRPRAGVAPARAQALLPALVGVILVLGLVAARAWPVLPFVLIGVFWFAFGGCGRKSGAYSCGPRSARITPPPGR